jgi:hypothetical protein
MISTVEVPHLKAGQKIRDYQRLYLAATSGYKKEQQLGCLPLYIGRTDGEKELAYQAATKDTIQNAFKFLEELIDGPPCEFLLSMEFFSKKPKNGSMDAVRSYFFELYDLSQSAKIPTDVFLKRFLTQVPSGKKLYDSNKDKIKPDLGSAEVTGIFQGLMEKLQKNVFKQESVVEIKEEPFVFSYEQRAAVNDVVPQWAREMQDQLSELRTRVGSAESGFEEQDMEEHNVMFQKSAKSTAKKASEPKLCFVCHKPGHFARECYARRCETCEGKGHSASECPSMIQKGKSNSNRPNNSSRPR